MQSTIRSTSIALQTILKQRRGNWSREKEIKWRDWFDLSRVIFRSFYQFRKCRTEYVSESNEQTWTRHQTAISLFVFGIPRYFTYFIPEFQTLNEHSTDELSIKSMKMYYWDSSLWMWTFSLSMLHLINDSSLINDIS